MEESRGGFFLEKFIVTLKRVLLEPLKFFENLQPGGPYSKPLAYACLVELSMAAISAVIWGGIFAGFILGGHSHLGVLGAKLHILSLFIGLLILVISIFGASFAYYIGALICGARSDYRAIFRMYAYTESAVIFRLIPLIGGVVAEIYRGVLLYFGFKAVSRLGSLQAFLCAVAPGLILLSLIAICGFSFYQYLWK